MDDIIEAFESLLRFLLESFGPIFTVVLIGIGVLSSLGWRVYQNRRKDKYVEELLDEKEAAKQRMAENERMWKKFFLRSQTDWSEDQIDAIIDRNDFSDPVEAREKLEGRAPGKSAER